MEAQSLRDILAEIFFRPVLGITLPSPYLLGLVMGVTEFFLALLKRSKSDAVSKDRRSLPLGWMVILAGFGSGIFLAFNLKAWDLPWHAQFYMMGICLFLTGLTLRWTSVMHLGRYFTVNVSIAPGQPLILSGPYQFVRHPSYTGGLTMVLGFCLCVGNLASLLAIVVPCTCIALWRIHIEEDVLIQTFGEQYREYTRRTRRLVPFLY